MNSVRERLGAYALRRAKETGDPLLLRTYHRIRWRAFCYRATVAFGRVLHCIGVLLGYEERGAPIIIEDDEQVNRAERRHQAERVNDRVRRRLARIRNNPPMGD